MVETLEGLGMLPTAREGALDVFFRRGASGETPDRARPMPTLPGKRGNTGIVPPWVLNRGAAQTTHTPFKPLEPIFSVPPHTPPIPLPGLLSPAASPAEPPRASAITSSYVPAYSPADVVDESTWTPPDDALVQDQYGLDAGVDSMLKDDLYASQDYQADGEDDSLWGLGAVWDDIPYILPQAIPTDTSSSSSSGGWLSSLGNFVQSALPAAAQVYASVQATKQGMPAQGAAIAQGARPVSMPSVAPGGGYPSTITPPSGYGAPSWFSQRTILSSMSNGAVVGIAAAAGLTLLMVLKKRRGA